MPRYIHIVETSEDDIYSSTRLAFEDGLDAASYAKKYGMSVDTILFIEEVAHHDS